MIKLNFRNLLNFIFICFLSVFKLANAAPDVVAQNYAAANSPGIQSCTAGYDLMSGDIAYQQPLISSKLPYSRSYKAPLRLNLSASQTFAQPENTTTGWSDNYQSSIIVQNIDIKTTQYQNYSVEKSTLVGAPYYLTTSNPLTTTLSVKQIIMRLPGETTDTVFKEERGEFTRLYSTDAIRDINNYSIGQLSWSNDLGEYTLSRSNGNLIITKNGIKYIISNNSYTIAPTTTFSDTLYLYINTLGNLETTRSSWLSPNKSLSNTARYLTAKSTVSANLYRVTRVEFQGQNLNLKYDDNLNLSQVTDNFENKLIIEHNFDDPSIGSGQTIDESRLVTKVSYADAGQEVTQIAEFKYESYDVKIPSTGITAKVYALIESNSTTAGQTTYVNALTELGAMKAYVASKGRTADSSYYYPVLKQVQNSLSQVVRQWDVTQNYVLGSGNTYSTAQTTLRSFIPGANSTASDNTSVYNDITRSITTSIALGSSTGSNTVQTTLDTSSNSKITISSSGYPCLTSGKAPVSSAEFNTERSRLIKITDANNVTSAYGYDAQGRVTAIIEAVGNALSRTTTYVYGVLANNTANPFTVPTEIKTPNLTVSNVIDANGNITSQTQTSPQTGSKSKVIGYTYYSDATQPNYGLLQDYDAPRGDINDHTSFLYDGNGNIHSKTQIVNNASGSEVARTTTYSNYNSAGLAKNITYPDGSTDEISYDAGFRVTGTVHNAAGAVQTTGSKYDVLGRLIESTDADGQSTGYVYDEFGRLHIKVKPNKNAEAYYYHSNGVIHAIGYHQSNGTLSASEWQELDSNGRVSSKRNGGDTSSRTIAITYDANGNVVQTKSSNGIIEKWSYDALNRVTSHTDGNGFIDTKDYDASNNNKTEKAANNRGSNRTFVNNTNLATESNDDFGSKSYQYDVADNMNISQHGERSCSYGVYDQLGRNSQFNCVTTNGQSHPNLQINESYKYDGSGFGNLDSVDSATVNTTYAYDTLHRVISKKQQNESLGNSLTSQYSYSSGGNLLSITYPSGRTVSYGYQNGIISNIMFNNNFIIRDIGVNGADLLTGFHWGNGNDSLNFGYTDAGIIKEISNISNNGRDLTFGLWYDFDKDGRITKQNYSLNSDASTVYHYDNSNQLIGESSSLYNVQYSYDQNGNRTQLNANGMSGYPLTGSQATCTFNAISYTDYYSDLKNAFGYNTDLLRKHWYDYGMAEGRTPCGAQMPQCSFNPQTYVSLWSDLKAAGVDGDSHYRTYGVNEGRGVCPANGNTSSYFSYGYSANHLSNFFVNGVKQSVSNMGTGEFNINYAVAYDYAGRRLVEGPKAGSTPYENMYFGYNHKNERTLKTGRGVDRQYIYDESSQLLGEYDLSGKAIVEYIWLGDRPVAAIYPNNRIVYLATDHQSKPRRGFDAQNGQLVWSWDPDAFGMTQPTGSVQINLRFPGQVYDEQSGLYYNHNRYYNPQLGRYMEADPIGLEGGLNPYAYAGNNPVMNVDPSGLDFTQMSDWTMSNAITSQANLFASLPKDYFYGDFPSVGQANSNLKINGGSGRDLMVNANRLMVEPNGSGQWITNKQGYQMLPVRVIGYRDDGGNWISSAWNTAPNNQDRGYWVYGELTMSANNKLYSDTYNFEQHSIGNAFTSPNGFLNTVKSNSLSIGRNLLTEIGALNAVGLKSFDSRSGTFQAEGFKINFFNQPFCMSCPILPKR